MFGAYIAIIWIGESYRDRVVEVGSKMSSEQIASKMLRLTEQKTKLDAEYVSRITPIVGRLNAMIGASALLMTGI